MGESSFWYRPTRVVPDQRPLNGRCCCCCYYNMTALLWLYAGLIESSNPLWLKADLVVCANPSCSSWVSLNVSSGTGSPGQSRTKGRYMVVCVCVYYHIIAGHYSSPRISCIAIMPPPGSLPLPGAQTPSKITIVDICPRY